MAGKKWTPKEEAFIKKHYNKLSIKEIAKRLDRSYNSVQRKAQSLGVTDSSKKIQGRPWTEEEINYMFRFYEKRGVEFIANKFNRSIYSVKDKALSLGLNVYAGEELFVRTIANCFNCDSSVINRWIDKFELPCRRVQRGQLTFKSIDAKEFWKWAEQHKDIIPWHKYEYLSINPQPYWVKDCKNNCLKPNDRTKITLHEMSRVNYLRNKGMPYKDIAELLGRTVESVKHMYKDYVKYL